MDSKWERTQPYITINQNTMKKIMYNVKKDEKIKDINLIKKGLRNSNYCVQYENYKLLLRIYGFNDDWWKKEQSLFDYVKEKVRVPELLYVNSDCNVIDKPYAVFQYIEGPTLDEYLLEEKDTKNIISEIGQSLARLHEVDSYNEVGFFNENLEVAETLPKLKLWYDMFLGENSMRKLGKELTEAVRIYIENNAENIERIEERIALVHNDFRPINIIVDSNHSPYFIDWEGAMAGHVIGDIGEFLRFEDQINLQTEKLFIDNYNLSSKDKLPKDYKDLARLRDFINLLQLLNYQHDLRNKDGDLIKLIRNTVTHF